MTDYGAIANALKNCDWTDTSIGTKAIIQAAINALTHAGEEVVPDASEIAFHKADVASQLAHGLDINPKAEEAALVASNLLRDIRQHGLLFWDPYTVEGREHKAQMLARIDAFLAAAPHPPRQDGAREGEVVKQWRWRNKHSICGFTVWSEGEPPTDPDLITETRTLYTTTPAPDEAVEAEREAIAAWLEKQDGKGWFHGSLSHCLRRLANAIRARSRRDVGGV